MDRPAFSRMPSYEDCIPDESKAKSSEGSSSGTRFEGTVPRDLVVNPSFDDIDDRGPAMEHRSDAEARTSLPSGYKSSGHSRNLSEHFYESAKISKSSIPTTYSQEESRGVGQKFRRSFSGDVSNPPDAHRRINSIGNAAPIVRRPYLHDRQHQRVDSAGLDILTAAVDASQEELADAAGHLANARSHPHFDAGGAGARRSTPDMIMYDHTSTATPGGSSIHHHRYPSGPSPGYYAPPGYGYPSPYYGPPSFRRTLPGAPPPPPGGYPVQYARGPDPYNAKPSQNSSHHQGNENPHENPGKPGPSSYKPRSDHIVPTYEKPGVMIPPPPVPPSHWRGSSTGGSTHGAQSYSGSMGIDEGTRSLHTSFQSQASADHGPVMDNYHHRKTSSTFSWAPPSSLMGGPPNDFGEHPLKGHHRTTSSSVSFPGLDVAAFGDGDAIFLKNLHSSTGANAPAFETKPLTPGSSQETPTDQSQDDGRSKLASGGTSKRVRRKCNIEGCLNRVVQGGLCINHGAKRKHCSHPGCTKNVKKAGLCSTHGPARKKCDAEGCTKVAVQGGRCIAHGAKKKLCCVDGCTKQAILSSMCKKHHDSSRNTSQTTGAAGVLGNESSCQSTGKPARVVKKPTHTRGLSLFQEMSAEAVGSILGDAAPPPADASHHHHRSTFSRDFANIYEGD